MRKKNLMLGVIVAIVTFFMDQIISFLPIRTEGLSWTGSSYWVCGGHLSCVIAPLVGGSPLSTIVFSLLVGIVVYYLAEKGYLKW